MPVANRSFWVILFAATVLSGCIDDLLGDAEHLCDTLAAHPADPNKVGSGVAEVDLQLDAARTACEQAVAENPDKARFQFQLGRVLYFSEEYDAAFGWVSKAAASDYAMGHFVLGNMYVDGTGTDPDSARAQESWLEAAELGAVAGWANVAWMYETGAGVAQDFQVAVRWYEKAAEQNDTMALANLAALYHTGNGVEKNFAEAYRLYELAAAQGDAYALGVMGGMYMMGDGVELNDAKAYELLSKASDMGDPYAKMNLASMHQNGYGIEKNDAMALGLYLSAAEQGLASAQNKVADMIRRGQGIKADPDAALDWYLISAKQGDPGGQTGVGYMYRVVLDYKKSNSAEAAKWFQMAADQGYAEGQYWLGYMHEMGYGVSRNYPLALQLYLKAAEQGFAEAQNKLGFLYSPNGHNELVENDAKISSDWYRKSAEQGDRTGQYHFGWAFRNGTGVERDIEQAIFWWSKAANRGHVASADQVGHYYYSQKDYASASHFYRIAARKGSISAAQNLAKIGRRNSRPSNVVAEISSGAILCTSVKGIFRAQAIDRANNHYAMQSDDCVYLPRPGYIVDMTHLNGGISKVRLTAATAHGYTLSHNISK